MNASSPIAAVIAAAGFSRRMGRLKQLLPWGDSTVIATTAQNLAAAGAAPVVCAVGHRGDEVAAEVQAALQPGTVQIVYNQRYNSGEMLSSFQAGVAFLQGSRGAGGQESRGAGEQGSLLSLGDQPHVPVDVLQALVEQAQRTPDRIVIPSHNFRRGHPIYLPRTLWPDLLALGDDETLRTLIVKHDDRITYVNVDTPSILQDMDTPSDYERLSNKQ